MAEFVLLVAPVFLDLDVEFEEDFLVKEGFDVLACEGAYALEHLALVADDDALLAIALDIDDGHDVYGLVALVKLLDDDLCGIGYFLVIGK